MACVRNLWSIVMVGVIGLTAGKGAAFGPLHAINRWTGAVEVRASGYSLSSAVSYLSNIQLAVLPDFSNNEPTAGAVEPASMPMDGCTESGKLVSAQASAMPTGATNGKSSYANPIKGFNFPDDSLLRWGSSLDELLSRVPKVPGQGWLRERHKTDPDSTLGWEITCGSGHACGRDSAFRCLDCETHTKSVVPMPPYRTARFYFLNNRFYEFELTFEPESYDAIRRSLVGLGKAIETAGEVHDGTGGIFDQKTAAWHTQYVDIFLKKRMAVEEGILIIDYKSMSEILMHNGN